VTVLSLIAIWFRQLREEQDKLPKLPLERELLEALQRMPISFGMALRLRDKCKKVAVELQHKNTLFVLGKGYAEPIGEWRDVDSFYVVIIGGSLIIHTKSICYLIAPRQ